MHKVHVTQQFSVFIEIISEKKKILILYWSKRSKIRYICFQFVLDGKAIGVFVTVVTLTLHFSEMGTINYS